MFENVKREIINTALEIKNANLIKLAGGNVSVRLESGEIIVTPSGMSYEGMKEDDLIVMDIDGNRIEGELKQSVDTVALLHIYKHLPDVNAIIHTHQPYATAVGLIMDTLPVSTSTLANVTLGEVSVAPYSSPGSLEMGLQTVDYINGKRAVILKHHGVVTVGSKLKEALYAAIYMEDAAKTHLAAMAAGTPAVMTPEQTQQAVEVFKLCGQSK